LSPNLYKKIGRNIRAARKARKQTQEDLGKILGVSKTAIVNYESAQRKISLEHIVKLCKLYELTVNDLLGLKEKEESEDNHFFRVWREEFEDQEFTENEITLLIDFAKLLLNARSVNNGESVN